MYLLLIAAAAFLFSGATLAADTDIQEDTDGILVLNATNFNTTITRHNLVTVMFYLPDGEISKEMVKVYAEAAETIKFNWPEIKTAKVDASTNSDLAGRFVARVYPIIVFFKDGKKLPCTLCGKKTKDRIEDWVMDSAFPPDDKETGSKCFGCFGGSSVTD